MLILTPKCHSVAFVLDIVSSVLKSLLDCKFVFTGHGDHLLNLPEIEV